MKFIYEVNQEIEQYKYRIIYGSGISAVELYMSIAEQGKTVDFFCDMEGFPAGKQLLNRKIITLEEAAEFRPYECASYKTYLCFIRKTGEVHACNKKYRNHTADSGREQHEEDRYLRIRQSGAFIGKTAA